MAQVAGCSTNPFVFLFLPPKSWEVVENGGVFERQPLLETSPFSLSHDYARTGKNIVQI